MSTVELAQSLSMPKSSVVDLCQTLADLGCLRREPQYRFSLGDFMSQVSRGLFEGRPLLQSFHRAVQSLNRAKERTVIMAILAQSDIAIVAVHHGRSVLPITAKVGLYLPAWTTASGFSLLSEHSQLELDMLLAAPTATSAGVPGHRPSADVLYAGIQAQKVGGFFVDQEQTAIGMCGVSAPLYLRGREKPMAAITVAAVGTELAEGEERQLGRMARTIASRCAQHSDML